MAEWNPPYLTQNGDTGSTIFRRLLGDTFGNTGKVIGGIGALKVTQDTGTNMHVLVAAGGAVIPGSEETGQGSYYVYNDASVDLTVTSAHATYNRKDIVVARCYDQFYSGAVDEWALEVIQGPEDGTDVVPATPDNSIVLAELNVDATETEITNALITDRRALDPNPAQQAQFMQSLGGRKPTDTTGAQPYGAAAADVYGIVFPWDVYVVGVSVSASKARTAGTGVVQLRNNGTNIDGLTATIGASPTQYATTLVNAASGNLLAAGDRLDCYTTFTSLEPTDGYLYVHAVIQRA